MKKWSARAAVVILAVAICFCLTGCYRIGTTITVNDDGSVDVGLDEAISKQSLEQMSTLSSVYGTADSGSALTDALSSAQEEYAAQGWKVEAYEDDNYQGAKMSYHIADLKSVSTSEGMLDAWAGVSSSDTYSTTQDETASAPDQMTYFYYDASTKTYTLRMDVSALNGMAAKANASAGSDSSSIASALGTSLGSSMIGSLIDEFSFTITLPTAPISSNATHVSNDGKTLTWTYDTATDKICDSDYIECTFSLESATNWTPVAIGVGVVVVIAIIMVIVILSKKRKSNQPASE